MSTDPLKQLLSGAQESIDASVLVGGRLIATNRDAILSCIKRGVKVRFLFPSLDSAWLDNYLSNASVSKANYSEKISTNADIARSWGVEVRFHLAPVISWFAVVDRKAVVNKPISFVKAAAPSITYSSAEVQEFADLFDLLWKRASYNMRSRAQDAHTGELRLPESQERKTAPLPQLQIFLCHSSRDKSKIRPIYQKLLDDGFKPWLDEKEILPGQDWNLEIISALRSSDVVILFLSKESVSKTGYLQKELRTALDISLEQPEGNIFLIPAKLEECDVPVRLSNLHYVNLFDSEGYTNLTRSLRARQRQKLGSTK